MVFYLLTFVDKKMIKKTKYDLNHIK